MVFGEKNNVNGSYSKVLGESNNINGNDNLVNGKNNNVIGNQNTLSLVTSSDLSNLKNLMDSMSKNSATKYVTSLKFNYWAWWFYFLYPKAFIEQKY